MSEFQTVTKLEAANRQLCTAIKLFFDDGDAIAVHTLACAAREIYEKHCAKAGHVRMFDFVKNGNPNYKEKELWNLLNAARNVFKHEGESLDQRLEFDDSLNDFQLLAACTDCATLCTPHQPAAVEAYTIWFLATQWPDQEWEATADPEATFARGLQIEIDKRFPGLRTASRDEKKRFGRRLLEDALAGRLVERILNPNEGDVRIAPGLFVGA